MHPLLYSCALILLVVTLPARALEIRPGLWMLTLSYSEGPQPMPGLASLLLQYDSLPVPQRQTMAQLLAALGMRPLDHALQVCIGAGQPGKAGMLLPAHLGCSQDVTAHPDGYWQFRFQCADSQGEGEMRLENARAATTRMWGHVLLGGQPLAARMQSRAHWVSDDCAGLPAAE